MLQYGLIGLLVHDIHRLYQMPDASASRFAAPPPVPSVGPAATPAASGASAAAAAAAAKSPQRESRTREA